jgi:hypothetical protein
VSGREHTDVFQWSKGVPSFDSRIFHSVVALILLSCIVCPFVELALGWDNSIFMTGHDTETTLAVIILLLELIIALARILRSFSPDVEVMELIVSKHTRLISESGLSIVIPDTSPPVPLRI